MTTDRTLTVSVTLSDEVHAALARRFNVDEDSLADALSTYVQQLGVTTLDAERRRAALEAAEQSGTMFVARYKEYGALDEEKFLTPQEATGFLSYGVDDGRLYPVGVFDEAGNDLGWSFEGGWPAGSPYRPDGDES